MDMTGEKFNSWTVIGMTKIYRANKNRSACIVRCNCGAEAVREPDRLRSGRTKACPSCTVRGAQPGPNYKLRKPPGVAAINHRFEQYKRSAKRKNLVFELDRSEFEHLVRNDCYYCGEVPTTRLKSDWDEVYVNGIDRVNSDLGYEWTNCVTACWVCNSAKKSMTNKDFAVWVKKIYHNFAREF